MITIKDCSDKYEVIDIFPEGMDEKTIDRKFKEMIIRHINNMERLKNSGYSLYLKDKT